MKNHGFENTLNIIALSDAFRRHAVFANPADVQKLVEDGRKIAVFSTYYYPEYPTLPENKKVDEKIREVITGIAGTASRLNVDTVILPLTGDRRSWITRRVNQILKDMDLPVKMSLQKGVYGTDLSSVGAIDKDIKTVLDEGVRGLVSVKQNLLYSWDR
ncbi:MAG: hypothetical protein ACXW30_06755 [Micavibrio sp.]